MRLESDFRGIYSQCQGVCVCTIPKQDISKLAARHHSMNNLPGLCAFCATAPKSLLDNVAYCSVGERHAEVEVSVLY